MRSIIHADSFKCGAARSCWDYGSAMLRWHVEQFGDGAMLENGFLSRSLHQVEPVFRRTLLGRWYGFRSGMQWAIEPSDIGVLEPNESSSDQ